MVFTPRIVRLCYNMSDRVSADSSFSDDDDDETPSMMVSPKMYRRLQALVDHDERACEASRRARQTLYMNACHGRFFTPTKNLRPGCAWWTLGMYTPWSWFATQGLCTVNISKSKYQRAEYRVNFHPAADPVSTIVQLIDRLLQHQLTDDNVVVHNVCTSTLDLHPFNHKKDDYMETMLKPTLEKHACLMTCERSWRDVSLHFRRYGKGGKHPVTK